MKSVNILGSTGSIGKRTIDFIKINKDKFYVKSILAGSNIAILQEQINALKPEFVGIVDSNLATKLQIPQGTKLIHGSSAGKEIASIEADITMAAVVGIAGLELAIQALIHSKRVAIANKESIVCGWFLLKQLAEKYNREIIPVDSEHSGLFQLLDSYANNKPERLVLTCSGGPFLQKPKEALSQVTIEEALNHPRWKMGNKITIDSATLMNKALEKIEAHYLFDFSPEKIDIIIHPESIIHAMIGFKDGSFLMQASNTDMILPIGYALSYPKRMETSIRSDDFSIFNNFNFSKVDKDKFKSITIVDNLFADIKNNAIIFNAANEVAVKLFLESKIGFLQIYDIIEDCLSHIEKREEPRTLDDINFLDQITRKRAYHFIGEKVWL